MATASLTIPSPKMTENSLGCCDGLIRVKAATESVALMVALNLIINTVDMTMASLLVPRGLIHYNSLIRYVSPKMVKNETKVPMSP